MHLCLGNLQAVLKPFERESVFPTMSVILFLLIFQVKQFFESLKAQGSHLDVFQIVLETISKNIKWLEKNLPTLRSWLLVRT